MAEKWIKTIYCWIWLLQAPGWAWKLPSCQIRGQSNASHLSPYPVLIILAFFSKMRVVCQIKAWKRIFDHTSPKCCHHLCLQFLLDSGQVSGNEEFKQKNFNLSRLFFLLRLLFFFSVKGYLNSHPKLRKCDKKHGQSKIYMYLQK